ncbi:MAG: ribosome maturation factor RimM [Buchnera aphidicola (Floraphis choui)]
MAKFGKPHGILGWIRVFSFTEEKQNIFKYYPWYIQKEKFKIIINVKNWKDKNKYFLVKIKNINNRSIAEKLTNYHVIINQSTLPKLQNDNYYWKDVIGCNVFNIKNKELGIVTDLMQTFSNDILVVNKTFKNNIKKKQNILIPFIEKKIIKTINISNKTIIVDWNYIVE